ncbi:MAG: 50S ribosomal protein L9 [Candidatus Marinimicrobia bacterium]|jgi:large subunit ribosomal protein L9|nr:50S ribosomal protein L9 [Candidatus Neomarinimicrobiota bacterium]MAG20910.1 50S ribosomal protein L9 [Candidatus Neomarinimicrobiota bacterium]MDP6456883.1 50S ribosomal protein L9 [Candidatus Neomarinimicrobiota bacterium]MDP6593862.1 50S ribosomal protein L9 [Candidatus Neomarinimicrobiota bacterium]MDP6835900.1 50S ribosomal protein L9 [Candidatus Neomarinimicrobiota bacterium]|tara:strand:+ start:312 stop:755 length:444 start_codon:yes stop_codon:yes gene_type:complete
MKVILRQRVEKLGEVGDIVRVKDGYARNYLIPRGVVVEATPGNLRMVESLKEQIAMRDKKAATGAAAVAQKLEKVTLSVPMQVGEEDKLFGSVTAITIAEHLKEHGFDLNKKEILLDDPIKALGIYKVPIKLHTDVTTEVKVYVIKE